MVESIVLVSLLWTITEGIEDGPQWIMVAAVLASIGILLRWCLLFGLVVVTEDEFIEMVKERSNLRELLWNKSWNEAAEIFIFKMGGLSSACNAIVVKSVFLFSKSLVTVN